MDIWLACIYTPSLRLQQFCCCCFLAKYTRMNRQYYRTKWLEAQWNYQWRCNKIKMFETKFLKRPPASKETFVNQNKKIKLLSLVICPRLCIFFVLHIKDWYLKQNKTIKTEIFITDICKYICKSCITFKKNLNIMIHTVT